MQGSVVCIRLSFGDFVSELATKCIERTNRMIMFFEVIDIMRTTVIL